MAQSSNTGDPRSAVEVGNAQRGGDWPRPGEEGFVHPDGTTQSESQRRENRIAEMDRKAAGSTVHGAPAQGGVQPVVAVDQNPSDLAVAQQEHTEWVYEAHAALAEDQVVEDASDTAGRHESPAAASKSTSGKTS